MPFIEFWALLQGLFSGFSKAGAEMQFIAFTEPADFIYIITYNFLL